jgi:hypothetical protein
MNKTIHTILLMGAWLLIYAPLIAQRDVKVEEMTFDIFKKINFPFTITSYHGFDCAEFEFNGRKAKLVKPKKVAVGRPWIWRARFWGVEPQTERALLDSGFHVVFCDVAELYGNATAITIWNKFYSWLRQCGLSKKACMEGFSRGGVYVYNWAAENPGKVACVYADAPVLDLKSWPGGKGKGKGSPKDWKIFKKDYGFTTDSAAMQFKGSPIDKVNRIVKGGYPMLHVVGDADDVVPVDENTGPFVQKVLAKGGQIMVIHKPGVGHHPHSLPDPAPIVAFIMKAVQNSKK